ncbi:MAG: hypothetical protein NTY19_19955 [Planctomycetota bacterium]|nr:hypothetical protein [Planctomycetota bacterium]
MRLSNTLRQWNATISDSDELFGDALERVVTWHNQPDVSTLASQPIRLRVVLRDADLYSLRFRE